MLDFIATRRPDLPVSAVPGLEYYIPDSALRRILPGTPKVRPELAALAQMYGYWTEG